MHAYWVRNKLTSDVMHRLDLSGICLMIYSSSMSLSSFEYYCSEKYMNGYFIINTIIAATVLSLLCTDTVVQHDRHMTRAIIFWLQGAISGVAFLDWFIDL